MNINANQQMRDLTQYLKEQLITTAPSFLNEDSDQTIRLNDFQATWHIKDPENRGGTFIVTVPSDYTDDDLTNYLNDVMMESMPCEEDLAKNLFGNNANHIIDARIEWSDKHEYRENKLHVTLDYDKSNDDQYKGTDDNLTRYTLDDLRLVVDWEFFDVYNTSDDGLQYDLWNIFLRTRSSNNMKYMNGKIVLDIKDSDEDLAYDNGKSELVK